MRTRLNLVVVLVAAALAGCKQAKAPAAVGPPATPVTVAKATVESVPFEIRVVGTVEASAIIQVKSQIAGQLLRAHFTEGQNVAKGDLLFEIDSRPFRESLRQAEAALSRDRAQLRQAEATLARDLAQSKYSEAEEARYAQLAKAGVVSKAQYDQMKAAADVNRESVRANQAAIESARAAIENDQAAIERAKLDIGYCEIRAPIGGRTGNLLVYPGNLVKANDTPMVVIHQIAPIFVTFSVPDEHLSAVRRLSAGRKLPVRASLQDDPSRAASGTLAVIDNTVDTTTGTIKLKGVFDNSGAQLWPGQFVNVVLTLDTIQNATVVPAEAVQNGQQGQFVYIAKPDNTVEPRPVAAGLAFGKKIVIEKGVAAGDTVVTDGQLRLFPGARIRIVDAGQIENRSL